MHWLGTGRRARLLQVSSYPTTTSPRGILVRLWGVVVLRDSLTASPTKRLSSYHTPSVLCSTWRRRKLILIQCRTRSFLTTGLRVRLTATSRTTDPNLALAGIVTVQGIDLAWAPRAIGSPALPPEGTPARLLVQKKELDFAGENERTARSLCFPHPSEVLQYLLAYALVREAAAWAFRCPNVRGGGWQSRLQKPDPRRMHAVGSAPAELKIQKVLVAGCWFYHERRRMCWNSQMRL